MKKFFLFAMMAVAGFTAVAEGLSNGVFFLSEGQYGSSSGELYFYDQLTGNFSDITYKGQNSGKSFGETSQYGTLYGDRIYVTSKQDAFGGGHLAVADVTMRSIKDYMIDDLRNDGHNYDGRYFLGVSEEIGYLGTSNGIFVIDLKNNIVVKFIEGTDCGKEAGEFTNEGETYYLADVYLHQIGTMVRVGDYVFASQQNKGILVINADTHELETIVEPTSVNSEFGSFGDIVLAKDGSLWTTPCAYNNWSWMDYPSMPYLVRIDPYTLEATVVDIPEDIAHVASIWSSWYAPVLQALEGKNRLVWKMESPSDYSSGSSKIYYFDIDTEEFGELADVAIDGNCSSMYRGLSVDHENDLIWTVGSTQSYGGDQYIIAYDGKTGECKLYEHMTMFSGYSDFPAKLFFTDDYAPEFKTDENYELIAGTSLSLNLTDIVTDKDNMDSGIIVSVESVESDEDNIVAAKVAEGKLDVSAIAPGDATVKLYANSNGKTATCSLPITVKATATGIEEVESESAAPVEYYNMQGVKVENPTNGVYVKRKGGKATKVVF